MHIKVYGKSVEDISSQTQQHIAITSRVIKSTDAWLPIVEILIQLA